MSRVTELEKALTTLFRKGTEVGYTETEIDEFLENIDYPSALQMSEKTIHLSPASSRYLIARSPKDLTLIRDTISKRLSV